LAKRGWVDIIADILVSAKNGENITDIMYQTRLSYPHMKEYLDLLEEAGLLDYDKRRKMYMTTRKGFSCLKSYGDIKQLVFSNTLAGNSRSRSK
jgi:predicted transcriptional regulator